MVFWLRNDGIQTQGFLICVVGDDDGWQINKFEQVFISIINTILTLTVSEDCHECLLN